MEREKVMLEVVDASRKLSRLMGLLSFEKDASPAGVIIEGVNVESVKAYKAFNELLEALLMFDMNPPPAQMNP